ncbi:AAA family ATPase [Candidatus Magnetomonas plexicatena]|uniref:AAA family ATPase n=1 Tax=Candidatus Magnetomonas plexicatena TaxID=2552947 RepID=UPI001C76D222|nr:AAA family ATPase [Nitrospirales bacterium LBB_01]
MLTRFKVSGFKNLIDVDIRFGPFTCIAGANGVGKSNLFDAILFFSSLAEKPFIDAAMSVRDENGRATDVKSIFHRSGNFTDNIITLEAEMIVPKKDVDDLGQDAVASITFLRYSIKLGLTEVENTGSQGNIQILKEELSHIKIGDASKHLLFPHKKPWRDTVIEGRRTAPFISTEKEGSEALIIIHQDRGENKGGGRPRPILAKNIGRTVLSTLTNATETRTAIIAKREMQSWRLLLLEPTALRKPDKFNAPKKLGSDGSNLPSTLYHLPRTKENFNKENQFEIETQVYAEVANRLSELIDDVYEISVDRDEKRELLTLALTDRSGCTFAARDLSDGTLRFLAAAVLELDTQAQGLICLEEPENGIHPARIPAMIQLLRDITTNAELPAGSDNPPRQVIINTHSPAVVAQVPDDSLLVAELKENKRGGKRFKSVRFSCLDKTWRAEKRDGIEIVNKGTLLAYLNPVAAKDEAHEKEHRVIDRDDIQQLLPFPSDNSK